MKNVVIVELGTLDQDKPEPRIKAIGITASKRAYAHRATRFTCLRTHLADNSRPDSLALVFKLDVQVIEQKLAIGGFDYNEANLLTLEKDVARELRIETHQEPFSCSRWVESTDALKAISHCPDAEGYEFLGIGLNRLLECDRTVLLQDELAAL